jgi:hypothetical protein
MTAASTTQISLKDYSHCCLQVTSAGAGKNDCKTRRSTRNQRRPHLRPCPKPIERSHYERVYEVAITLK